jgi:hypothetical protein
MFLLRLFLLFFHGLSPRIQTAPRNCVAVSARRASWHLTAANPFVRLLQSVRRAPLQQSHSHNYQRRATAPRFAPFRCRRNYLRQLWSASRIPTWRNFPESRFNPVAESRGQISQLPKPAASRRSKQGRYLIRRFGRRPDAAHRAVQLLQQARCSPL